MGAGQLDESRFRSHGKVRKGREALNEIVAARFERPMSLHKLFELLDIKAVVHGDQIEIRGVFPDQDGFGPRLLLGRRAASASAGKRVWPKGATSPRVLGVISPVSS